MVLLVDVDVDTDVVDKSVKDVVLFVEGDDVDVEIELVVDAGVVCIDVVGNVNSNMINIMLWLYFIALCKISQIQIRHQYLLM